MKTKKLLAKLDELILAVNALKISVDSMPKYNYYYGYPYGTYTQPPIDFTPKITWYGTTGTTGSTAAGSTQTNQVTGASWGQSYINQNQKGVN